MAGKRVGLVLALALVSTAVAVPAATAGKPTITRVAVDDTIVDTFLGELCGVPVETRFVGHEITRSFDDGGRFVEVFTLNVSITATSPYGTFRLRDVGADLVRVTEDGVVVQLVGKLPFWFNGTAWIDPITGEELKEPTGGDLFEETAARACAALAP
jgi:hypothetical protein